MHLLTDLMRRPWTGPALAAAGLLAAIALPPSAPSLLFWSLVALSSAGAALVGWRGDPEGS